MKQLSDHVNLKDDVYIKILISLSEFGGLEKDRLIVRYSGRELII